MRITTKLEYLLAGSVIALLAVALLQAFAPREVRYISGGFRNDSLRTVFVYPREDADWINRRPIEPARKVPIELLDSYVSQKLSRGDVVIEACKLIQNDDGTYSDFVPWLYRSEYCTVYGGGDMR
ncbi:MAG: hypothetical protein KBC16_01230 [Candidatus Pacebacteria bacterium]|nr:hypothetical protein [Candidatus Paceibacterota bacterium]